MTFDPQRHQLALRKRERGGAGTWVIVAAGIAMMWAAPASAQSLPAESGIRLAPTASVRANAIAGFVIDHTTGEPLRGVQLTLEGTNVGVLSDSTGRFRLVAPGSGPYHLKAVLIGYTPIGVDVEFASDKGIAALIGMEVYRIPMCGLIVCGGPFGCRMVHIEVRDVATGKAPVAPITLMVRGAEQTESMTLTPEAGSQVALLGAGGGLADPGPYAVEVAAPGYTTWRHTGPRRDTCGIVHGMPLRVWLLPLER